MVVLDTAAFSGPFQLASKCNSTPWYQSIIIGPPRETTLYNRSNTSTRTVLQFSDIGRLQVPMTSERSFWSLLNQIAKREIGVSRNNWTMRTREIKHHKLFLHCYRPNPTRPNVDLGDGPCQILVVNQSIEIGVDLMLAFKHPDPKVILSSPGFPPEYRDLFMQHGCHLVAKSCYNTVERHEGNSHSYTRCNCWFVSFAAMETEMMKRLDEDHKKCYKVMKAMLVSNVNYPGKCMNLSSYFLKNAFLFHVFGKNRCRKMEYHMCIPQILEYLKKGFENTDMPCFFARDLNVWGRCIFSPLILEVYEWEEYKTDKTLHAKLWVEFWRRVVMVIIAISNEANQDENKGSWDSVMEKMGYIRGLIVLMLEEYSYSKKDNSSILENRSHQPISNNEMFKPFHGIPAEVKMLFPKYIEEWKKRVTFSNFDIDRLITIDPCC